MSALFHLYLCGRIATEWLIYMKKSSFTALVLGTVSGLFFSLGMCMALLPEWNAFQQGIIFGCIGIALATVTIFVWRKMEKKAPIKLSGRTIAAIGACILGALTLGVGMCFVMVWEKLALGIAIGIVGIVMLLGLIPLIGGFKD